MNKRIATLLSVTQDEIIELLSFAKKRIIYVKPAFIKQEIEALLNVVINNDIPVTIFMEEGDSAIRCGFGDDIALKLLLAHNTLLHINLVCGLRVAILIVDDLSIIFMPELIHFNRIEDERIVFPNGFICSQYVTEDISKQLMELQEMEKTPDNVIAFPGGSRSRIYKDVTLENIRLSLEKLYNNPAVNPIRLQRVRLYRNNYKIVKVHLIGISDIHNWSTFDESKIFEIKFKNVRNKFNNYLLDAGRFGLMLHVDKKQEFLKEINQLKKDLQQDLHMAIIANKQNIDKVKFSDIDKLVNKIDIKCDFYDISDELILENDDFSSIIEDHKLVLREEINLINEM